MFNVVTGVQLQPGQYIFLPYEGFHLNQKMDGNYTCTFEDGGVTETTTSSMALNALVSNLGNSIVTPFEKSIYVFNNEPVSVYCAVEASLSTTIGDSDVEIYLKVDNAWESVFHRNHTLGTAIGGRAKDGIYNSAWLTLPKTPANTRESENNVRCIDNSIGNRIIWEWQISYTDAPRIYLNSSWKAIHCISQKQTDRMSVYSCQTAAQCYLLEHTVLGRTLAGGQIDGVQQSYGDYGPPQEGPCGHTLGISEQCGVAVYNNPTGMVHCGYLNLPGRDSPVWGKPLVFFSSLNGIWSTNWLSLSDTEMVDLNGPNGILWEGVMYTFRCRAVAFHFAAGAILTVDYMNGTKRGVTISPVKPAGADIAHEYLFRTTLTTNTANVTCRVFWWNTTDVIERMLPLTVIPRLTPVIRRRSNGTFQETFTFTTGTSKTLSCTAEIRGRPATNFKWEKLKKEGHILMTNTGFVHTSGETYNLYFAEVARTDEGMYRCTASNSVGQDEHYFFVTVEEEVSHTLFYVSVISAGVLVIVGPFLVVGFKYYKAIKKQKGLTTAEQDKFYNGDDGEEPYDKSFEVADNTIVQGEQIGAGEFGVVCKGTSSIFPGQQLAIKATKAWGDKDKFKAMLQELKLMIRVGEHPNVVKLFAACTTKIAEGKLYLVLGYCCNGDLISTVRRIGKPEDEQVKCVVVQEFCKWAKEIAAGMDFIHAKDIVHGDLAARNVLLDENRTAKITDFGLAKQLYNNAAYRRRHLVPLPWRWMAPESLSTLEVSPASDVWSFGITLWEMFSLGHVPYAGGAWNAQHQMDLMDGCRLPQPSMATPEIYAQMLKCWSYWSDGRAGFDTLLAFFMHQYDELTYVQPVESLNVYSLP